MTDSDQPQHPDVPALAEDGIDWTKTYALLCGAVSAQLRPEERRDVEDVASEALVRLCRALRRSPPRSLEALAVTIAQRTCADYIRRRIWTRRLHDALAREPVSPDGRAEDWHERFRFVVLEYFGSSPCGSLATDYFAGLDWRSVATRNGESPDAVRQRWKRCLDRLRAAARRSGGTLFDGLDRPGGDSAHG